MINEILVVERPENITTDDVVNGATWGEQLFDRARQLRFRQLRQGQDDLWVPEEHRLGELPLRFLTINGFAIGSRTRILTEHSIDLPITTVRQLVEAARSLDVLFHHGGSLGSAWGRSQRDYEVFLEQFLQHPSLT